MTESRDNLKKTRDTHSPKKIVRHLFPTYEVGSLPKLPARVKAITGAFCSDLEIQGVQILGARYGVPHEEITTLLHQQKREQRTLSAEERKKMINFNALLNLRIQEKSGIDFVYDGEARRSEMYRHVAQQVEGFENLPEMIRSRGPDSYRKSVCVAEPRLKEGALDTLVEEEFAFVNTSAVHQVKVPLDDPYMLAVMSDNKYYTRIAKQKYSDRKKNFG